VTLYRVFPYDPSAAPTEPGGALFRPSGGRGRIDNPTLYRTLYAGNEPECAIAELFGAYAVWDAAMFVHSSGLHYSLATLKSSGALSVWNMNDTEHLAQLELHPTDVIVRDRDRTQQWAARIFEMHRYSGISWWSYYGPQWQSCGLWDLSGIQEVVVTALSIDDSIVRNAANTIVRTIS